MIDLADLSSNSTTSTCCGLVGQLVVQQAVRQHVDLFSAFGFVWICVVRLDVDPQQIEVSGVWAVSPNFIKFDSLRICCATSCTTNQQKRCTKCT